MLGYFLVLFWRIVDAATEECDSSNKSEVLCVPWQAVARCCAIYFALYCLR